MIRPQTISTACRSPEVIVPYMSRKIPSNSGAASFGKTALFPNAESGKDSAKQFLRIFLADQPPQRLGGMPKLGGDQIGILQMLSACRRNGNRRVDRLNRSIQGIAMFSHQRDGRIAAIRFSSVKQPFNASPEQIDPLTGQSAYPARRIIGEPLRQLPAKR